MFVNSLIIFDWVWTLLKTSFGWVFNVPFQPKWNLVLVFFFDEVWLVLNAIEMRFGWV